MANNFRKVAKLFSLEEVNDVVTRGVGYAKFREQSGIPERDAVVHTVLVNTRIDSEGWYGGNSELYCPDLIAAIWKCGKTGCFYGQRY